MTSLTDSDIGEAIGRAADRYVRTHRQASMATVSAIILFDALRRDIETNGRRSVTAFSRPQLRDAMAAHPSWQGKAFEETSFNTVPEDLGEQLEGFSHEDFVGGRSWTFRFRGPTRKFRTDKASSELFLEMNQEAIAVEGEAEATAAAPAAVPEKTASRRFLVAAVLMAVVGLAAVATYLLSRRTAPPSQVASISLAVMPFHLVSGDGQLEFLRIGLADAIITELANHHQMRVRPTAAILGYGAGGDLRRAADEQKVDFLLTGTVQVAGGLLRTSVQLLQTGDLSPVWGDRFDIQRGNLLELQDEIARNVANALQLRASATSPGGPTTSAAFELYLKGRTTLLTGGEDGLLRALSYFESAIEADPAYARAWAGLAVVAANLQYTTLGTPETKVWKDRGEKAAKRAVELGPDLAETHEALAEVYSAAEFEWDRSIEEGRRAVALNPSLAQAHDSLARAYAHLGIPELAWSELTLSERANPLARADVAVSRARVAFFAGDFATARAQYDVALAAGAGPTPGWQYPIVLFRSGEEGRALELLAKQQTGFRAARARATEAAIHASRGRRREAEKAIAATLAVDYVDHHVVYYLGAAYAGLDDHRSAERELRRAAESGFPAYPSYETDPFLGAFRASAEGAQFMSGLREQWLKARSRYVR